MKEDSLAATVASRGMGKKGECQLIKAYHFFRPLVNRGKHRGKQMGEKQMAPECVNVSPHPQRHTGASKKGVQSRFRKLTLFGHKAINLWRQ